MPASATDIYTLSLHDALPIFLAIFGDDLLHTRARVVPVQIAQRNLRRLIGHRRHAPRSRRSEEHTSELQSRQYLVCRLLLEKKNSRPTGLLNPKIELLRQLSRRSRRLCSCQVSARTVPLLSFIYACVRHRHLHSFPTRRSSDLPCNIW